MNTEITVAMITGAVSILTSLITLTGVVISNKIDELTREVRQHNNFAQRVPVVEEQLKVVNHRIKDLEAFHKGGGAA